MATQLILTVGTNALPIWVAWHHLKDKLEAPIKVRLVHTTDTEPQKEVLEDYCEGADFLDPIETDSGDPDVVRNAIKRSILDDFSEGTLHVHYTGGTKVMGVETVSTIESMIIGTNYSLETSYLDPRGSDGPRIVRRSDNPSRSGELVPDTRIGIPVEPEAGESDHIALGHIAELNGFELGEFNHEHYNKETESYDTKICPAPIVPDVDQLASGAAAIGGFIEKRDFRLLEYGAYAAFKEALENICCENENRNNYKLFHSVHVRRANPMDLKVKPFELDVVALLGHQIVVVSCTVSGKHDAIKEKGMEAIIRSRQLGGDEARAIVLCSAPSAAQPFLQDELQDETGSSDVPLEVWGTEERKELVDEFTDYLTEGLRWE